MVTCAIHRKKKIEPIACKNLVLTSTPHNHNHNHNHTHNQEKNLKDYCKKQIRICNHHAFEQGQPEGIHQAFDEHLEQQQAQSLEEK